MAFMGADIPCNRNNKPSPGACIVLDHTAGHLNPDIVRTMIVLFRAFDAKFNSDRIFNIAAIGNGGHVNGPVGDMNDTQNTGAEQAIRLKAG